MSADLVSVVIPCRNAAPWIRETLESVLEQSDVAWDLVLVDDGSDDDTVAIAEAVGAPRLSIVRQDKLGASQARTAGTRAARGAFIQYLDADDVLLPGTLRGRLDALSRTGADVAYCNWVRWERQDDGSFADREVMSRTLGARPDVELFTDAWWPPGALMYRRTLVDRLLPWPENLPVIQDARFHLNAALAGGTFVHVDEIGLRYRVHGETSLSRRDPRAFLEDCLTNAAELQREWERSGALDAERHRALITVYTYLARSFFPLDRGRFSHMVERLRRLDPRFVPDKPPALRALSTVIGYPAAEHVAFWWRHLKTIGRSSAGQSQARV